MILLQMGVIVAAARMDGFPEAIRISVGRRKKMTMLVGHGAGDLEARGQRRTRGAIESTLRVGE